MEEQTPVASSRASLRADEPIYETVTIARNEAQNIGRTLAALSNQSLKPSKMIVVDDGSVDGTSDAASQFGCDIVRLPYHRQSYLGRPELASVTNAGLEKVSAGARYVVIVDADTPLPQNYVGELTGRMEADGLVAAASGVPIGASPDMELPTNSGFAVRTKAWRDLNGLRYPLIYGYEGWLRFKLIQLGFKVQVYADLSTIPVRGTGLKGIPDGRAMYSLGYDPVYAIGRVAINLPSQPRRSLMTLVGYFAHGDATRSDVADWVGRRQRARLLERARVRLRGSTGKR